ncbi:hypothetical protein ACHAW5_003844 [Stephanodiscus triporus]|uniref:Uncharacterized protein n=1 Tax=Stephanodiscus triporus TaxID=2934178 RepID=A0ABD3Q8D3_9STRA
MASFGVGGEFGVGGKFDNGASEYEIELPTRDVCSCSIRKTKSVFIREGWVDEEGDSGNGNPFANLFGGGKKKEMKEEEEKPAKDSEKPPKKSGFGWPF